MGSKKGVLLFLLLPILLSAQSVVSTAHNLSASGTGAIHATSETEICIFCHTPHSASPSGALWNRNDPGTFYTLYTSSTAQAVPNQPSGSSVLCLSCHDGTIALGSVISRSGQIAMSGAQNLSGRSSDLTSDLSDDHPVSILYNNALANSDGELLNPATLTGAVRLQSGMLQCTACHDPHDNTLSNFLVASNQNGELCLYCHDKTYWASASHKTSTATWNGGGADPWPHTTYQTVAENACESCHDPHNAGGADRILNYQAEEQNCLACHDGSVASTDIQALITKTYGHTVFDFTGVHDPNESDPVQTQHVECVDCHNPHAAKGNNATAPNAPGALTGARGVDTNGNAIDPVQFLYQVCYRCHGDSPTKPAPATPRLFNENNVRLEFDPGNPSYHPVEAAGKNNNVPSLISPLNESSKIYCTDCHGTNGGPSMPRGPHGSTYPHILRYNYSTAIYTSESATAFELCYTCHSRTSIINRLEVHKKHVNNSVQAPCNACHDPHGVNINKGNNTHLINFDLNIVTPSSSTGRLEFNDLGNEQGQCYLTCHNKDHKPKSY